MLWASPSGPVSVSIIIGAVATPRGITFEAVVPSISRYDFVGIMDWRMRVLDSKVSRESIEIWASTTSTSRPPR